jgi:hypothetical protein
MLPANVTPVNVFELLISPVHVNSFIHLPLHRLSTEQILMDGMTRVAERQHVSGRAIDIVIHVLKSRATVAMDFYDWYGKYGISDCTM